jgi:hypothetical protein
MKLIREDVNEVQYITEEKNGQKSLYIVGPMLVADEVNRNQRLYGKDILAREVARYNEEYISKNRAFGELGHPDTPSINLDRVSHMTVSLKEDGSRFIGKAKILGTPMGKIAEALINGGGQVGMSSRGLGSLKEQNGIKIVQDDYYLATAADIVADPSAPGAFAQGIMEGKEWVWNNGIVKEVDIYQYHQQMKRAKQQQIEEISLRIFENFLSKL